METIATECPTPVESQAAARNSRAGAELLADRFHSLYVVVYRFLLHRLFDADLAEELTAQTFYHAAVAIGRFRGNLAQLRVWLLRTALNLANTHHRRQRVWQLIFGQLQKSRELVESSEPLAEDNQRRKTLQVQTALKALAPKHQSVIALRYFMDMSFEEIAAVLGCREDAVRARLSRAVKAMRRQLGVPQENRE